MSKLPRPNGNGKPGNDRNKPGKAHVRPALGRPYGRAALTEKLEQMAARDRGPDYDPNDPTGASTPWNSTGGTPTPGTSKASGCWRTSFTSTTTTATAPCAP